MKTLITLILSSLFTLSAHAAWYPRLDMSSYQVDEAIANAIAIKMDQSCSGASHDDDTLTLVSYQTTPDDGGVEFDAVFKADFNGSNGQPALFQFRGMQDNFNRFDIRMNVTSEFCDLYSDNSK